MAKIRSNKIESYLEAPLETLQVGKPLPVDLHLYFASNRQILIWHERGDKLSEKLLNKYRARGMKSAWIHREDQAPWTLYLQPAEALEVECPETPPPAELPVVPPPPQPQTDEIATILFDPALDDRRRTALTARAARGLLAETVLAQQPELREKAVAHARDEVRDVLDNVLEGAAQNVRQAINEVWDISSIDPELDHAVNVSTFAVLFALAFGRISPEVLTDIALAGLLHDVGLTQIPAQAVQIPWTQQMGRDRQLYARHVDEGLRLLDELAANLSLRVKPLIQQHHEKFDGTGYPMQLQGFQVNDIAQLVAMADTLESISSGRWDAQTRSLTEAFDYIEKIEKSQGFAEFFNPAVFLAVARWIRNPNTMTNRSAASDIVRSTTQDLMRPNKA